MKKNVLLPISVLLLVCLGLSWFLWNYLTTSPAGDKVDKHVEITSGMSFALVADVLEKED